MAVATGYANTTEVAESAVKDTRKKREHGGARPGAGRKPKPRPTFYKDKAESDVSSNASSAMPDRIVVSDSLAPIAERIVASDPSSALAKSLSANSTSPVAERKSKKKRSRSRRSPIGLPVIRPNAAGIDIGSRGIFVAVPEDRADSNVRSFPTFTEDLIAIADWLASCGIEHVAMEATGVYWIPLFQILEKRGFNVTLVNARNVKNVPGRKSDVIDSRWIQFLHTVGLLQASFRPPDEVAALRSYMRHRDKLVAVSASHVLRMQKALTQMNIQLHNVISDITGVSGLAILDSVLEGERDPAVLADMCHASIKADPLMIRKSLVGDWRAEHLFTLDHELKLYRFTQQLIKECDTAMEELLGQSVAAQQLPDVPTDTDGALVEDACPSQTNTPVKVRKNASLKTAREKELTASLLKLFGTDLTLVPGIGVESAYKLYTELGTDWKASFAGSAHFCSYLGLCPDNRISGGKVLSAKTRHVPSRGATIFRLAANSLQRNDGPLGNYLRRMKGKLGKQEGITATAHKLARIIYHLVTTGETFNESMLQPTEQQIKRRKDYILREAVKLGIPLAVNSVPQ